MSVISRRSFLAGAAAFGAGCVAGRSAAPSRARTASDLGVDVHCHIFNGNDLPVRRFIEKTKGAELSPALVALFLRGILQVEKDARAASSGFADEMSALASLIHGQRSAEVARTPPPQPISRDEAQTRLEEALRSFRSGERSANLEPRDAALLERAAQQPTLDDALVFLQQNDAELQGWENRIDPSALPPELRAALREARRQRSIGGKILKEILLVFVPRFSDFLRSGGTSRQAQAAELRTLYSNVSLFATSLVDFDSWTGADAAARDRRETSPVGPAAQVQLLERLARAAILGRIPNVQAGCRFHGLVAFDPLREIEAGGTVDDATPLPLPRGATWDDRLTDTADASGGAKVTGSFRAVRHAIEQAGFIGVKMYPPVGFQPALNTGRTDLGDARLGARLDAVLDKLFGWCEREQVPVLAHCGSANAFQRSFIECAHPRWWKTVLEKHPRLRLDLGHAGHLDGLSPNERESYPVDQVRSWYYEALRLVRSRPNVYLDLADTELAQEPTYVKMLDEAVHDSATRPRLMYGSDWYMNTLLGDARGYYRQLDDTLDSAFGEVPGFMRSFRGLSALRFFGFLDENGEKPPSRNRDRLLRFYESHPKPDWL